MPTTAVILCLSFWVLFSVNLTTCHFPYDCSQWIQTAPNPTHPSRWYQYFSRYIVKEDIIGVRPDGELSIYKQNQWDSASFHLQCQLCVSMGCGHFLTQNSSMKHISSSRIADDCVIMSCVIISSESDLVLAVLSVGIPTDPDISWTVSGVSRLLKTCLRRVQSFEQCCGFAFFLICLSSKRNTSPHEVQKSNYSYMYPFSCDVLRLKT